MALATAWRAVRSQFGEQLTCVILEFPASEARRRIPSYGVRNFGARHGRVRTNGLRRLGVPLRVVRSRIWSLALSGGPGGPKENSPRREPWEGECGCYPLAPEGRQTLFPHAAFVVSNSVGFRERASTRRCGHSLPPLRGWEDSNRFLVPRLARRGLFSFGPPGLRRKGRSHGQQASGDDIPFVTFRRPPRLPSRCIL